MLTARLVCDVQDCSATAAAAFCFYCALFAVSRVVTPLLFPVAAAKLRAQSGGCGYWDSSVCSTVNGAINSLLVVATVLREPALLRSDDAFFKTQDSCRMLIIFLTWCVFESILQLAHWGQWEGRLTMMVHHSSAIAAWSLYLSGNYGHTLSLLGIWCELTNPFMNMRYFLSTLGLKSSKVCLAGTTQASSHSLSPHLAPHAASRAPHRASFRTHGAPRSTPPACQSPPPRVPQPVGSLALHRP
jgi:hypothetical protein